MTTEEAIRLVNTWGETESFGIHQIARALLREVTRLQPVAVAAQEWRLARREAVAQADRPGEHWNALGRAEARLAAASSLVA